MLTDSLMKKQVLFWYSSILIVPNFNFSDYFLQAGYELDFAIFFGEKKMYTMLFADQ